MSTEKNAPPRNPRSAFVCFAEHKQEDLKLTKKEVLKIASSLWAGLSSVERAHWDEEARNDKVRYVREKAAYKGPWNIPKRRAKKHPNAPKRPMSAFLAFSQQRRKEIKTSNPYIANTDISRLLGEMWRAASPKEKAPFVEQEKLDRAEYKVVIAKFRETLAKKDAASRTSHRVAIQEAAPIQQSYRSSERENWRHYVEPPIDRRIFRSYSGSGGHAATESNKSDKPYKESYFHHPYNPDAPVRSRAYAPNMYKPPHTSDKARVQSHHHAYRSYPQVENYNHQLPLSHNDSFGQQPSSLKEAGSDLSKLEIGQGSFGEPEPPFNSRLQRPSSSRYFTDSFYQYS